MSNRILCEVWNPKSKCNYYFPEQCYTNNETGLAISGGGSRSYTATIGYMRALEKLDLFDKFDYVSSVSGGSWFASVYLYANRHNLLGKSVENITYETLNETNKDMSDFMGNRLLDMPIVARMVEAKEAGISDGFLWHYGIGKFFLEHYGLFNKSWAKNTEMLDACNIDLSISKQVRSPYWLCNSSILFPRTELEGITEFQFTSQYSGFHYLLGDEIGSFFVENPGFGCYNPGLTKDKLYFLTVPKTQNTSIIRPLNYCTLELAVGNSSAAYAYEDQLLSALTKNSGSTVLADITNLNPVYNFWKPILSSSSSNSSSDVDNVRCSSGPLENVKTETGDGGICDNTGIMSLVTRGVKKIVSLDNNAALNGSWQYLSLAQLFGTFKSSGYSDTEPNEDSTQIFPSCYWSVVIDQFKEHPYCHIKLPVIENKRNGVKGGYELELLIIILQPSTTFNSMLPEDISSTFNQDDGPFPNFPNYPTILANKDDILGLTLQQINLLSTFTEWSIMSTELRHIISSMI